MPLPDPVPGLVVGYGYLWSDQARRGREEGRKDRPCVIVVAVRSAASPATIVLVAPITHSKPLVEANAFPLGARVRRRLHLDERPSWIIADDLNQFIWPGADLRAVAPEGRFDFGLLPNALFELLRNRVIELLDSGGVRPTARVAHAPGKTSPGR